MRCEICGADFLNSDEFNAHIQKHLLERLEAFGALLQSSAGSGPGSAQAVVEAIAQRTAELVLGKIPGPVFSATAAPREPHFSFEVMQIAQIAMLNNKGVDEVVALCRQAKEALG